MRPGAAPQRGAGALRTRALLPSQRPRDPTLPSGAMQARGRTSRRLPGPRQSKPPARPPRLHHRCSNWTAAVALMDRAALPAPPLTLTASILVSYKEPAPPDTPLVVRSSVVEVKEGSQAGVSKVRVRFWMGGGGMRDRGAPGGRGRRGWLRKQHTTQRNATHSTRRLSVPRFLWAHPPPLPRPPQSSVEVDVSILQAAPEGGGAERLLVSATGIFKKLGALRSL